MLKEFKEFAMRGNVVNMAVGIIIGGAFGSIWNHCEVPGLRWSHAAYWAADGGGEILLISSSP